MEINQQAQSWIFQFPPELRELVWSSAFPKPAKVDLTYLASCIECDRRGMIRTRPKTYSNMFALTCRRAYWETRHRYYRASCFAAKTPADFENFMEETRPENLALIQEIDVTYLWSEFFPDLSAFRGLKTFNTSWFVRGDDPPQNGEHPRRKLLRSFVARARCLKSIQTINIMVSGNEHNFQHYASCPLDLEDLGWTYSVRQEPYALRPGSMKTVETLRLVHRSH